MNGNHICDHGVDSQELLNKSELILSGHFHKREERKYKNGTILYVGSPHEQSWGECGDQKGVYILDILDGTLDFISNTKSPKHIKIRLSELLAVGKVTDNIKNEFKGNIINFLIDKEIEQKSIDTLLTKFYTLNPISIKTENTILMGNVIATDETFQFEGIDIKNDIISFIDNSSDVENKAGLIKYLVDVYDQCNEVKE
jgi:DNA repair exonuclease SbcCD nuclease subunit